MLRCSGQLSNNVPYMYKCAENYIDWNKNSIHRPYTKSCCLSALSLCQYIIRYYKHGQYQGSCPFDLDDLVLRLFFYLRLNIFCKKGCNSVQIYVLTISFSYSFLLI